MRRASRLSLLAGLAGLGLAVPGRVAAPPREPARADVVRGASRLAGTRVDAARPARSTRARAPSLGLVSADSDLLMAGSPEPGRRARAHEEAP